MRSIFAYFFKHLFKIPFFKTRHFGIYKRVIFPTNLFKGVERKVKFKNVHLELNLADWIQHNIYFLGTYEEIELNFLEKELKGKFNFLDIGANIGIYSLIASKIMTNKGKVFSFEPFHTNFIKLNKHKQINCADNIETINLAVSNEDGIIEIRYQEDEQNLGMASSYIPTFSKSEKIKCISIDNYFNCSIPFDFIKIDIEGGEYLALLGMEKTINMYHPKLLIEVDDDILKFTKFSRIDMEVFLEKLGYNKFYFTNQGFLTNSLEAAYSKNVLYQYVSK